MDLDHLRELLELLEERDIAEFELEEGNFKLRVRKQGRAQAAAPVAAATAPAAAAGATAARAAPAPPAARTAVADPDRDAGLEIVKSPIVGTFYSAPDPNSPPFVDVGDRIKPGQVLCIIEAMKLMNEIEAEIGGEVVRIHKENGQPVQYGEPLFAIRP
jgi:acetyl-CoA carboxylase biotin carboxyl carrier protein